MEYVKKTPQEKKDIADGLRAGTLFCDRHIHGGSAELLSLIFMPLALMSRAEMEDLMTALRGPGDACGIIYEEISKAGPRGINGYPQFMSFKYLSHEDTKEVFEIIEKIDTAIANIR